MMAIAVDSPRHLLWASTAALPHAAGYREQDKGKCALLAFDPRDGKLVKRFDAGGANDPRQMGDLAVAPNGDVYVSDGGAGCMYRARPDAAALEIIDTHLTSPQGPVFSADGRRIYVADYVEGIATVDLPGGACRRPGWKLGIATNGIDGLTRYGNSLIGVQNGAAPKRIMRYLLDPAGTRVVKSEVLEAIPERLGEPTHGVIVDSRYYFTANAGFSQFDQNGKLPAGVTLSAPQIRVLDLKKK